MVPNPKETNEMKINEVDLTRMVPRKRRVKLAQEGALSDRTVRSEFHESCTLRGTQKETNGTHCRALHHSLARIA